MKVLITTDWYAPVVNGVVTSVLNLKRELEERGHDVRVLTLSTREYSYQEKNVYYLKSINIDKIYPNARAAFFKGVRQVKELIAWKPDIVHSQCEFMTFPYAVRIKKKCGCPLIHTYHTVYEDYTHYFSPSEVMGKKAVALWSRQLLKKTDCVIAPTKKVKEILESYQISQPVHVIPTGIDLRKYTGIFPNEERENLKAKLGIPKEHKVLVNVGRLAKEKNLEEILMFLSNRKDRNITLLLAGDGPYRKALEEKSRQLGLSEQVIFAGMVDPKEVWKYYQLGEVFLSASNSETQGLTYIEALASGIPALCRKDACLEQVIVSGYNGFQYETEKEFQSHLDDMLAIESYRMAMAGNARESTDEYSTWTFCNQVEQLYRKELAYVSNQYDVKSRYSKRAWGLIGTR